MTSIFRAAALASSALTLSLMGATGTLAQTAAPAPGASTLPPVVVNPAQPRRAARAAPRRAAPARAVAPRPAAPPPVARSAPFVETATGPVRGYVARLSSSGTKTSTPIIETPQSVSVIGADQIRDQKIVNKFDEVLQYSPGVIGATFGNDQRNDWFLIRGFKAEDTGLYLDGLQLNYTSFATWKLQPFNLERVEILRGPSAVLYGGSAPGGLVNAISKLPQAEPIRYIEAGVNNFGNAYTQFDLGGPVTGTGLPGAAAYRLVGQLAGGGTQVDFVNNDNFFIAPSFTWQPDIDTRFTIFGMASAYRTKAVDFLPYVGTVTAAPFGRIPTNRFTGDPNADSFTRKQEMVGYQFEKNITDSLTVRQNARLAHVDINYVGLLATGYDFVGGPASGLLSRGNFVALNEAVQGNLDTQLEYRFASGPVYHKALLGVDLRQYRIDDIQGFSPFPSPVPPLNVVNPSYPRGIDGSVNFYRNVAVNQSQVGVYVQDQMKIDRFTLVLSGRNDWVEQNGTNRIGPNFSREDSKFTGRAGLIYNFDNGVAPYVSYATGYNPLVQTLSNGQPALPETSQQAEIGFKYEPVGSNMRFSAALFDLKRQNVLTTDPNFVLASTQTGAVTSRGIELEAVANITPDFKVVAAFTHYALFITKDDITPAFVGKVLTNTPREAASLWVDYTLRGGWWDGLGFGGGVRYVGPSFADQANLLEVPSRVLGDLAAHYEWAGWRAQLNVRNVADTAYVASCSTANACFYGERRRITGSLSYKW